MAELDLCEPDEVLIKRFQKRYQDRVFRIAAMQLRRHELAADAAQEVFLRALTWLRRFRFGAR